MPTAAKAREDILQILNKTWSPCCSMKEGNFKAFGNTPMVDLFKDLDMGKKLDILLVQQGDIRHIMKTIAAMNHYQEGSEQKSPPDQVTFRFVDAEPANIARNALIFELIEATDDQAEDMEFVWNVWFNSCLSGDHLDRLHGVLGNLLEEDSDFEYERNWTFADEKSRKRVKEVWEKWMEIKENGVFREGFDNEVLFEFERSIPEANTNRRYATKWPYKRFAEFQGELNKWNESGVLSVGDGKTGNAQMANPTMFRKGDVLLNSEPKLCPLALFCPVISSAIAAHSSLTETCFVEFVKIIRDMKLMLKQLKVQVNFEIGDSLEYLSSHKERKYNLIHTSGLADSHGLTNVLLVCEQLLKQKNSVLVTTTEREVYIPRKDYIQWQTGCIAVNLPMFLGIQMAENVSLGQNLIGKDSPVQVYRWVKCIEAEPAKISLKDSPSILNELRRTLTVNGLHVWNSAMTLATIVKRFQEHTSDNVAYIWEKIKDLFDHTIEESLLFVFKILGIVPSASLRIAKVTLDATRLGLDDGTEEDHNGKGHKLVLAQPNLFHSFIPDIYKTDTYCCNRETETITLLLEEEEYQKKLKYNINCTSNLLQRPFLSEVVKAKSTIVLGGTKTETQKLDRFLLWEDVPSYHVILHYKGKLNGEPTLTFDKRPCRVSICYTDSNGKTRVPLILACQITSEFYKIEIEKTANKILITLYKDCLQRLGHHLLPLSKIKLESLTKDFVFKKDACAVLNEVKSRDEFLPNTLKESYCSFITTRLVIQHIILRTKWITPGTNALIIRDVSKQQMFLKIHHVYIVEGYPLADVTVFESDEDDPKNYELIIASTQNGWIYSDQTLELKTNNVFDILKYFLFKNSKRMPQISSAIPGSYRSFMDIRFSDFDDTEIPKSREALINLFQRDALPLDFPCDYGRCCYCLKFGTSFTLCDHCGEALYCDDKCLSADFVRHVVQGPFRDNTSESNEQRKCDSCGQTTDTAKACSKCKEVYYCHRKCQEKDWPNHKKTCKKSDEQTTDPKLKKNLLGAFTTKPAKQEGRVDDKTQASTSTRHTMGNFHNQSRKKNTKENVESKDNIHIGASSADTTDKEKIAQDTHNIDTHGVCGTPIKKKSTPSEHDDVDKPHSSLTSDNGKAKEKPSESALVDNTVHAPSLHCANCRGPASNLITCIVCSQVKYCGYQCQLTHWPQHHKQCVKHLLVKFSEQL